MSASLGTERSITYHGAVPDKAIEALGRFARVVSDAAGAEHVLALLADALAEHVCPDGVAIYALEATGAMRLAAERGLAAAREVDVDLDDLAELGARLCAASGDAYAVHLSRPLVAGASLYGEAVMLHKRSSAPAPDRVDLADALIDLAAVALGTAAHVQQLERQFEELRAQQDILARTEKLRALGQMAAGVSHDLKNILNPLSLHIQVVTRAIDRGDLDGAKDSALEMKQIVQRGVQTLDRLRDFSRQSGDAQKELVDLDCLAREAAAIGMSRVASGRARAPSLREELGAPPRVSAVSSEVLSALVNLVVNAIDAGSDTITLRSGADDAGSWVEVRDDGPGMPPEVAARIFEPFFTTKGDDGTGLGLAMVYATMQRHGGSASIESASGQGATLRLSFPRARAAR